MLRFTRRSFLATCSRAGLGAAALTALPRWARAAVATPIPPRMIQRNDWPEHWETGLEALGRDPKTPNDLFFVRSHFPAPELDPAAWRLEIAGRVASPASLSLEQLKALPAVEATHTLECAGNGRGLFHLASTSGTQWGYGAVGNARWRGARLATVLEHAGVGPEARHAWFEAADRAPLPGVPPFLRSIPIGKAMDDTLLVWSMNGAPLPRLHGGPVRVIVPGWYGMASTKWVTRIRLEAEPSDNHFMARGYRYAYPGEDPANAAPVETMRVKSLITWPLEGARIRPGAVSVLGFAWAGPAGLERVEVSDDGGASWAPARFTGPAEPLAWRRWQAEVTLARRGSVTLMARATDGAGESQPLEARPNAGGYGNNSIHRVTIDVRG